MGISGLACLVAHRVLKTECLAASLRGHDTCKDMLGSQCLAKKSRPCPIHVKSFNNAMITLNDGN
jgi:hypothetical protein